MKGLAINLKPIKLSLILHSNGESGEITLSDAPRAQDNLSKLLSALSAIAAPSDGTLKNFCTFLARVLALRAAMVESAVSNFDRLS